MLEPAFAPVKPRVRSPCSGQILLLEDFIGELLDSGTTGIVAISGRAGSGKTTALRHLSARMSADERWKDRLRLFDHDQVSAVSPSASVLAICASRHSVAGACRETVQIAPWGRDELIEYLLAVHPQQCRSVLTRIERGERLEGLPLLWRAVLDELAENEHLEDVPAALEQVTRRLLSDPGLYLLAGEFALASTMGHQLNAERLGAKLQKRESGRKALPSLSHPAVQLPLAVERVVERLERNGVPECLSEVMPSELIREIGSRVAQRPAVCAKLCSLLQSRRRRQSHAMAVSLLIAADRNWRPESLGKRPFLKHARLDGANWPDVNLERAELFMASLQASVLTRANLARADLTCAKLCWADLRSASLNGIDAPLAEFSASDLTGANLTRAVLNESCFEEARFCRASLIGASLQRANLAGASLVEADLSDVDLTGARLDDCDFSGATLLNASLKLCDMRSCELTGASLDGAKLYEANLEEVRWTSIRMPYANLGAAVLTGSCLPGVDLRGASLVSAGLGEIDWEGADLRSADLREATFHMGSSRNGLLFTPYAGEGSKTGFYTDDFDDRHFKPPEEIRKANLCGADLRGACITGTDFYLVDLRGAFLDDDQRDHLERCGAILADSG